MNTLPANSNLMADMLVRRVLGSSSSFARVCAQNGLSIEDGVRQALDVFMQENAQEELPKVEETLLHPSFINRPDASDCPAGEEAHWLKMCEHDLRVLHRARAEYDRRGDVLNSRRAIRAVEHYIQAQSSLRERVACG
jgi:hypothetical protein